MDGGPILRFELRRIARQRRSYAIRAAVGFGLIVTVWFVKETWVLYVGQLTPMNLESPQALRALGVLLFSALTLLQGIAVVFLVPGLVAGSIAEEDRRGTMTELLASPLSSRAIVLGKLGVQLVRTGLALSVGLPFVLPFAMMGVLDRSIVASVYAMLLAWTLFVASLSILTAVVIPRPRLATLTAYALVVGWLLGPFGTAPIAARFPWPLAWLGTLNDWAMLVHPAKAVQMLAMVALDPFTGFSSVARVRLMFSNFLPAFAAFQVTASILFVSLAVFLLRPLRLGVWSRSGREPSATRSKSTPRPPIGDDPALWKEWYATGPLGRPALRGAFLMLCLLLFLPLVGTVGNAFMEWRESWSVPLTSDRWRTDLNVSLRQLQETLYFLGFVAAAAIAATSVTGEREGGTWTSLETTLLTGREVARAKVLGALSSVRLLAIPLLIVWNVGLTTGSVHPLGVAAASVGVAVYFWYAAAVGTLVSMVSRSSEQALGITLLALFAGNAAPLLFVPLSLVGTLTGTWSSTYLAGSTPLMTWASLLSSVDIQEWLAGRRWDLRFCLPGGIGMSRVELNAGLARTYVISLASHAVAATIATWAAARAFDKGRGRR